MAVDLWACFTRREGQMTSSIHIRMIPLIRQNKTQLKWDCHWKAKSQGNWDAGKWKAQNCLCVRCGCAECSCAMTTSHYEFPGMTLLLLLFFHDKLTVSHSAYAVSLFADTLSSVQQLILGIRAWKQDIAKSPLGTGS